MDGHILIIDDDSEDLRRLRRILTEAGYSIMTATDWQTATTIMQRVVVNKIICSSTLSQKLQSLLTH